MPNNQLNYRYRHAHNYKEFGNVVFSNPTGLSIEMATLFLREKLISEEFFDPKDFNLKGLNSQPYNPEVDHEWHEFESFEITEEQPTDLREVEVFLESIKKGHGI